MSENCVDAVCGRLIHRYDRLFGPVFYPFLQQTLSSAEAELSAFCQGHPEIACDPEAILYSLGDALTQALFELCSRSLIGALVQVKARLLGETPEERYQYFVEHMLLPTERSLPPESELGKLAANRAACTLAAFQELLTRLAADLPAIQEALGISVRALDGVSFRAGDTHNGGRFVMILTVNGGERLVYKPRSLETDAILWELMQWMNAKGGLRFPLKHLRYLNCGDHGWQEYIAHRECGSPEEAEAYMYRVGALLFLAYLTSFSDLHQENLIAHGDTPILIDTETIFRNNQHLDGQPVLSADNWNQSLLCSVFSSGLLPVNILPGKVFERSRDSGLLTGLGTQPQAQIQTIAHAGTDEMCFSEEAGKPRQGPWPNLAYLAGRPLHPGDYIESVAEGFRSAYEAVMRNKAQLMADLAKGALARGKFRQILRDTALYQKFLLASYHPYYVHSRAARLTVFEKLHGKREAICPAQTQLVQEEIAQLLRDDIPYFYTTAASRALLAEDGCVIEEFYRKTVEELLQETVDRLDEGDFYRQLFFIRTALESTEYDKSRNCFYPIDGKVFSEEGGAARFAALADWILGHRERFSRVLPEGDFPLYHARLPGQTKFILRPEPATLTTGIGSFLFYDQYARIFHRRSELAEGMLRALTDPQSPLVTRYHNQKNRWVGVFEGYGSYLYLYLYLYRFTGDARYVALAERVCDELIALAPDYESYWGVTPGHAGVVILALNAWKKRPDLCKLRELAEVCGKKLYEAYKTDRLPFQTGFAYGYAGISTALVMLGAVSENADYYSAGMDLMRRESAKYDPSIAGWRTADPPRDGMNGWCYGSPGILVARELARPCVCEEDLPLLELDLSRALGHTLEAVRGGESRPVLCHGLPGNLSILQWYARHAGDPTVRTSVEEGISRLLHILEEKGILYCNCAKALDITFMVGTTGLGYFLLQQLRDGLPAVLALEVF